MRRMWLGVLVLAALAPACGKGSTGDLLPAAIEVTPAVPSIALGTTQQFTATAIYTDMVYHRMEDFTGVATWSSSDPGVATVLKGRATAVGLGSTVITATYTTYASRSHSSVLTVTSATLTSIEVSSDGPVLAQGTTRQFAATGFFSDNTMQDLTSMATWSSSNDLVATVNSQGLATGVSAGAVTISAGVGLIAGTAPLTVNAVVLTSIDVTPVAPSTPFGNTLPLTATGTFSDGSTQDLTAGVTWLSSDITKVKAIAAGVVKGVGVGSATITAAAGPTSGSTVVTTVAYYPVTLTISPNASTVGPGRTLQLTGTAQFSGPTFYKMTQLLWSSSNPAIAAVSNAPGTRGLVTGVSPGVAFIEASDGWLTNQSTVTVSAAALSSIAVTPASPSIQVGQVQGFTAIGTFLDGSQQDLTDFVTWSSSNISTATIRNSAGSHGRALGLAVGLVTITATLGATSGAATLDVQ